MGWYIDPVVHMEVVRHALFCTLIVYRSERPLADLGWDAARQLLKQTIACHWHTKPLLTSVTIVSTEGSLLLTNHLVLARAYEPAFVLEVNQIEKLSNCRESLSSNEQLNEKNFSFWL